MDAALELKTAIQDDSTIDLKVAKDLLEKSELFHALLTEFEQTSINLLHRLIQLSEIPFSQEYQQVKDWRDKLA
ncbi:MAG: hypothetical protein AAFQ94_10270, partial [Bacteroidota bacterium]